MIGIPTSLWSFQDLFLGAAACRGKQQPAQVVYVSWSGLGFVENKK